MKMILIIGLLSITFCFAQTIKPLKTNRYAGVYSFGDDVNKGAIGSVTIYPETDSTILFYVDVCRGAPSYNLGQLYGRLKINDGKGEYSSIEYDDTYNKKVCKWQVTINKQVLTIKTLNNCYECGFGANVIADNQYNLKNNRVPQYFTDGHNHKIFFSKTSPEDYLK